MIISINNAIESTQIFLVIFIFILLLTLRPQKISKGFHITHTQELKGLAILAIIFSHIGYFLVNDHNFLFPLSIGAGVGVNLFLFLSGYGLTISALSKHLSITKFYKNRLPKLYIPLWLTVLVFLMLDFLVLKKSYSFGYISQSLLGFFPKANLWTDLNSPLWYFSFIVFYYLLFPLVFYKKHPWLPAIALYLVGYFLIQWNPQFLNQVIKLYRVHMLAFPLGVLVGGSIFHYKDSLLSTYLSKIWTKIEPLKILKKIIYYIFIIFLLWIIYYTAYHSHVGDSYKLEQLTSLLTCAAIIILFLIKRIESRLLYWFGFYSFEIYLTHWPILSRFDIFYRFVPAWLATIFYLTFFIVIAWVLKYITKKIRL